MAIVSRSATVGGEPAGAFRVGVTRDLRVPDGTFALPVGLDILEQARVRWEFLADHPAELPSGLVEGYDALFHFSGGITATTLERSEGLALVARHGVGLDMVDLGACTERGVAVTITPDGIRRPMASAALALVLALSHRLVERNAVVHAGAWHEGRFPLLGLGLTGRTLGVIGFGTIGRELVRLAAPLEMRVLVTTPRLSPQDAAETGVQGVELETLLAESDVVVVCCRLTPETHHLLDGRRLARMKPTALLVNVARGAVVDEQALVAALRDGRLAGAGLDVFEREPVDPSSPLLGLGNVVAAPHALGYTDELFRGCVESACSAILAVAAGRAPRHVANPAVLDRPAFLEKLRRLALRRP
jgi:phosphoglycerate dehydrogenase-like enzyme